MTTAARNPITLAREVLAAEKVMDGTPGLLYLDGPTHEHEEAASATLDAAPDLAHAVIRMDELADRLDDGHLRYLIRAALNGETHD